MHFLLKGSVGDFEKKNLVATITEFLSLFFTSKSNIYIKQGLLYVTELKVTPITFYFFWNKYEIITNAYM